MNSNPGCSVIEMGVLQAAGTVVGGMIASLLGANMWQGALLGTIYGSLAYLVWECLNIVVLVFTEGEVEGPLLDFTWKTGGVSSVLVVPVIGLGLVVCSVGIGIWITSRLFSYDVDYIKMEQEVTILEKAPSLFEKTRMTM